MCKKTDCLYHAIKCLKDCDNGEKKDCRNYTPSALTILLENWQKQ